MNRLSVILLVIFGLVALSLSFAAPPASVSRQDQHLSGGIVYGYGMPLQPDFVFTGVGTDTLFLNGYPYDPTRSSVASTPAAVSTDCRSKHELCSAASEFSKRGRTREEGLVLTAEVFRASPLVDRVEVGRSSLWVYWKDGDSEEVLLPLEGTPVSSRTDNQQTLIMEFHMVMDRGGFVAFGEGYHVVTPSKWVPKTLALIARLDRGELVSDDQVKDTPLQNKRFFADLVAHRNTR